MGSSGTRCQQCDLDVIETATHGEYSYGECLKGHRTGLLSAKQEQAIKDRLGINEAIDETEIAETNSIIEPNFNIKETSQSGEPKCADQ